MQLLESFAFLVRSNLVCSVKTLTFRWLYHDIFRSSLIVHRIKMKWSDFPDIVVTFILDVIVVKLEGEYHSNIPE